MKRFILDLPSRPGCRFLDERQTSNGKPGEGGTPTSALGRVIGERDDSAVIRMALGQLQDAQGLTTPEQSVS
jgi:hypothetical protein